MEAAGLSTGVVSLAFDVFDNTIRLFKFLSALVDMPKDCEKYRLQLIIEYNRVLAWGKAAGLVDIPEGSTLASSLGTNATELVSIVARIQWLLAEFRDINGRYENELNPDKARQDGSTKQSSRETDVDIVRQISTLAVSYEARTRERRHRRGTNHLRVFFDKAAQNSKEIATHPARVRWVMVDQDAFEALLKDLHVLTERLHELMRGYRQRQIDDITAKTYREMILTRNGVQDLRDMLDAVTSLVATSSATGRDKSAHRNNKSLQDLVRLKKISRTSEIILSQLVRAQGNNSNDCTPFNFNLPQTLTSLGITVPRYTRALWDERFCWSEDYPSWNPPRRPQGILSTDGNTDIPVWIEYKALGNFPRGSLRDHESGLRTVALAEMLSLPKPASMYVPECIGYFDDREISKAERYGWIFRMPPSPSPLPSPSSNTPTTPQTQTIVSLYTLLGDPLLKPTLSQRLSLASRLCSTLLDLHAANWLHKGIFSDNVLFPFSPIPLLPINNSPQYDPTNPYLSGFEFSRPSGTDTTSRDADLAWDLYRWPGIQRQPPTERNSRKTYDLYSLGLVLLEIAHWEPMWRLLGLEDTSSGGKGLVVSRVGTMMTVASSSSRDSEGDQEEGEGEDDEEGRDAAANARISRRNETAFIPQISLADSKRVRGWLLGITEEAKITNDDGASAAAVAAAPPFSRLGRPNPVHELRNIMGDRYCEAVTRCLWAHGDKGFGIDEKAGHHDHVGGGDDDYEGDGVGGRGVEEGIKLQEAFTKYVVEQLEGVVV